jgi:hypothetical protein
MIEMTMFTGSECLRADQSAGDPLYVAGGQPKCFDPDLVDDAAAFAEDGYKIRSSFFILIVSVYLEMNSPWKLNNI